jgi:hypothetical protein
MAAAAPAQRPAGRRARATHAATRGHQHWAHAAPRSRQPARAVGHQIRGVQLPGAGAHITRPARRPSHRITTFALGAGLLLCCRCAAAPARPPPPTPAQLPTQARCVAATLPAGLRDQPAHAAAGAVRPGGAGSLLRHVLCAGGLAAADLQAAAALHPYSHSAPTLKGPHSLHAHLACCCCALMILNQTYVKLNSPTAVRLEETRSSEHSSTPCRICACARTHD